MNHQSWSIIIFAFNEENSIKGVLDDCYLLLEQISSKEFELIIVNDGSSDNTSMNIKKAIQNKKNIKFVEHNSNLGIGKALLSGYQHAKYENVCAVPADGQFDVFELLPYASFSNDSMISFYRVQKTRYTPYRKLLSYANRIFNKYILGIQIKDVNWIKIYKQNMLNKINPVLSSSLVESEIMAKMVRFGCEVVEVESVYHQRQGGISKGASIKIVLMAIPELLKLIWIFYFRFKKV